MSAILEWINKSNREDKANYPLVSSYLAGSLVGRQLVPLVTGADGAEGAVLAHVLTRTVILEAEVYHLHINHCGREAMLYTPLITMLEQER